MRMALLLWNHDVHIPLYVPLPPDRVDLYKTDPEQQRRAALARGVTPVVVEQAHCCKGIGCQLSPISSWRHLTQTSLFPTAPGIGGR